MLTLLFSLHNSLITKYLWKKNTGRPAPPAEIRRYPDDYYRYFWMAVLDGAITMLRHQPLRLIYMPPLPALSGLSAAYQIAIVVSLLSLSF